VLHEALRLCPPGPALSRMVIHDIEVEGHRVEAGAMAVAGTYTMHHDQRWDDPLVFDSDRFSPQDSNGRDRWQHLPFGGDPRSCISDHFASARSHPDPVSEQAPSSGCTPPVCPTPRSRHRLSPRDMALKLK
jgi:cytochrome P450